MSWYARNMSELQPPNRTIGFTRPTRGLINHQTTSWTQQLYKDKHTRVAPQRDHQPHPYTPLQINTVTDPLKICPFCAQLSPTRTLYLHGDITHLHVHFSNEHIHQTRTNSNTYISTALRCLGALFSHVPYPHNLELYPFRNFLCALLHQYDDNIRCDSPHSGLTQSGEPY